MKQLIYVISLFPYTWFANVMHPYAIQNLINIFLTHAENQLLIKLLIFSQ